MPVEGQTVTNEQGGSQSFIEADFECIPPKPLRLVAQCLGFGRRKYGFENWKKIPLEDNLAHAMNHINEWRAGDRSEPHLINAIARLFFALSQAIDCKQQPERYIHPDQQVEEWIEPNESHIGKIIEVRDVDCVEWETRRLLRINRSVNAKFVCENTLNTGRTANWVHARVKAHS